jgi:hypothetical protein
MPHARHTDPSTSHQAAASVSNITPLKKAILRALQTAMCDTELSLAIRLAHPDLRISDSSIRSRRAELVDEGFVEDSGIRVKLPSGRHSIAWVRA